METMVQGMHLLLTIRVGTYFRCYCTQKKLYKLLARMFKNTLAVGFFLEEHMFVSREKNSDFLINVITCCEP